MKSNTSLLLACVLLLGCGGGGSSGSFFGGIWRVSLITTENTCGGVSEPLELNLTVNQLERDIAIESEFGNAFSGAIDGEQSFFASRQSTDTCVNSITGAQVAGSTSVSTATYRFTNIEGDEANVSLTIEFSNCSTNSIANTSCRIVQQGGGLRQ